MKKEEKVWLIIIGVLIIISLLSFAYFLSIQPQFAPLEFIPRIPQECTNENIITLWQSVFKTEAVNLNIFFNNTQNFCVEYIAIKTTDEEFYIIKGTQRNNSGNIDKNMLAFHGNGTVEYLSQINITALTNETYTSESGIPSQYLIQRNILTLEEANNTLKNIFQISEPNLTVIATDTETIFNFSIYETIISEANTTINLTGRLSANYTLEYIKYVESIISNNETCQSNYTAITTACMQADIRVTWYNDTNSCEVPNPALPANTTTDCDFNEYGVIGNSSEIEQENVNLQVYIDENILNTTRDYNGTRIVQLREEDVIRVEFRYNFEDDPFNLREIEIEQQAANGRFGYIIIEGLDINKTVRVNQVNQSNRICIRDREVSSISDVSSECTSSSEVLLQCPGNTNRYTCEILNGKFIVTGLSSSAVKEIQTNIQTRDTSSSTQTTNNNQNNQQNNSQQNIPSSASNTPSAASCVPSWSYTEWQPAECPKDGRQTRVATDNNNCGTNTDKEPEVRDCEYQGGLSIWVILIIILMILIIAIACIIIIIAVNKKNKSSSNLPPTSYTYNPRQPPQNPQVISQRPQTTATSIIRPQNFRY